MSLPNPLSSLFKGGPRKEENYLSIVLTPDRVLATIWSFEQDLVKPLGFGKKTYKDQELIIRQAALAIDSAGEQAKVDVTKTVFGLSEFFLEDGSLSRQSAKTLKNLSAELDLDPQAFVPLSAGINHLLKVEEGTTPHAVLVGIFGDFCEVNLMESGQAQISKSTQNQLNIEKLKNLINSLKEEGRELPARIIVYGQDQTSDLAKKIEEAKWDGVFAVEPKIDFLDDAELSKSAAYAQAADVLGYDPTIKNEKEPERLKNHEASLIAKKTNDLGFVEGEDILLSQKTTPEEPTEETAIEPDSNVEIPKHALAQQYAVDVLQPAPPQTPVQKPKKPIFPKLKIPKIFDIFKFDPSSKSGKKILIALALVILLFFGTTFVLGQTITKAQLTIRVSAQEQNKDFSAKAVSGAGLDKNSFQIPGTVITGKASGSGKTVATGTKKLGDPAKGAVVVYNWTNAEKSFSKGTGIISKNGIKFALDGDTTVASRSASAPGQSNVNVVAQELGPSGNLDAGQDFNFQQFDTLSYSAQNTAAFSGGAQRQATVVTQSDLDKLEKSQTESLTQKAKEDLNNQANGQKIDDGAIIVKVLKKQFDKKLDEEASLINLDMEIEANVLLYSEDILKNLLAESFASDAGPNLQISPTDSSFDNLQTKRKGDILSISGTFKEKLIPKLDENALKDQIAGKSTKDARAKIREIGQVQDVEVKFTPNVPILSAIPRNKDRITFKIETN